MVFRFKTVLVIFLITLSGVSALNCTTCFGKGESCRDQGKSTLCPGSPNSEEGICGRVNFLQNDTRKVLEGCVLKKHCVGSIDCKEDGFELGKRYSGASHCVVGCCEGDNCNPPYPLRCHRCKGAGKTCSRGNVSCGYGEDRCIRINFMVNGTAMVNERCYQSSRCGNQSEICDLVKTDYPSASDCKQLCCEGNHCNYDVKNIACALVGPLAEIMAAILLLIVSY